MWLVGMTILVALQLSLMEPSMNEYWEITRERSVATQAVWGMQLAFELNGLTRTQHGTLSDSLAVLAQARDTAENNLTDALAAKHTVFAKLSNVATRMPGLIDGMLDDEDELKHQLDAIYGIDANGSENSAMHRARLLVPLWTDVNTARVAALPPKPELTLDYLGVAVTVAILSSTIDAALTAQKTEADKQRLVTNAKSALRTADHKTDRANKRWYKAWLKAFPVGTPEGDAAVSQIFTGSGTPDPSPLNILSALPQVNQTVIVSFDPAGGANGTTKELQYQLPGELEFGHSTPITGNSLTVGPFTPGATISFRTRVANSNPGVVTSPAVVVVIQAPPPPGP